MSEKSGKFYMLVNPYIEGTTPKVYKAENSLKAAKIAYDTVSKYFNNSVHNFKFSLLKLKSESVNTKNDKTNEFNLKQYSGNTESKNFNSKNFSHYTVSEKINKNNTVNYEIKTYSGQIDNLQHLINNVFKIQQKFINAEKNNKSNPESKHVSNSNTKHSNASNSSSGSESGSRSGSGSSSKSSSGSSSSSSSGSGTESESHNYTGGINLENNMRSSQYGGAEHDISSIMSQNGGKKLKLKNVLDDDEDDSDDFDDSDDDDSPDFFIKKYSYDPISYWYYYPSIYSLDRLYLPTFISPLSFPYVLDMTPHDNTPTVNITL